MRLLTTKRGSGAVAALLLAVTLLGAAWARQDAVADTSAGADFASAFVPGYDISWPQCEGHLPGGLVAFTIVGLNGGRPFTDNPCFLEQYRWAQHMEVHPAIYVNTDYPKAGRDEPAKDGPYGRCTEGDEWCRAYNYGHNLAKDVIARAAAHRVTPSFWWLDVETGNYWSDDPTYNAQALRGVIEYFKVQRLPFGVYSTPRQWRIIAGTYAPGVPVWTAGAQGVEQASSRCRDSAYAFAGGTVKMVQYYDFGFDTNYVCPGGHPVSLFPLPDPFGRTGPASRSLRMDGQPMAEWRVVPMVAGN